MNLCVCVLSGPQRNLMREHMLDPQVARVTEGPLQGRIVIRVSERYFRPAEVGRRGWGYKREWEHERRRLHGVSEDPLSLG